MNVFLIDVDSVIPNLSLMKISYYEKDKGNNITLKKLNMPYYPNRIKYHYYIPSGFDKYYISCVFEGNKEYVISYLNKPIMWGGSGYNIYSMLPESIEKTKPDYSIYPENNKSYGFITRGCIRNCYFCIVPKKEGYIHKVNNPLDIIEHDITIFLDNNILAYGKHLEILEELIDIGACCQFNQGLDIRLLTDHNSALLSEINYYGDYIFAFDSWSYKSMIEMKLDLLSWIQPYRLKFYIYVHPSMGLDETVKRIEWCKDHKCLPYIMRDISCWASKYEKFYTDIASYANQPGFFKNLTFPQFLRKRHERGKLVNHDRINHHTHLWRDACGT